MALFSYSFTHIVVEYLFVKTGHNLPRLLLQALGLFLVSINTNNDAVDHSYMHILEYPR